MTYDHYFLSYSGLTLPLKLVGQLEPDEIDNRNTYFGVITNEAGLPVLIHKRVYGEIELEHEYTYYPNRILKQARIHDHHAEDMEIREIHFNEKGVLLRR